MFSGPKSDKGDTESTGATGATDPTVPQGVLRSRWRYCEEVERYDEQNRNCKDYDG
jgi:hypothetical protein